MVSKIKISANQERAIKKIETIIAHFGKERWFIQEEIPGAGNKTMKALVNKGYLNTQTFEDMVYYQRKMGNI